MVPSNGEKTKKKDYEVYVCELFRILAVRWRLLVIKRPRNFKLGEHVCEHQCLALFFELSYNERTLDIV